MLETEVNKFIEKQKLLHKHAVILVGVSGGPDSMALLHFFQSLQEEWDLRLIAVTADHGLRGKESRQDVDYVRSICESWNIEFVETFLDVPSYKKDRGLGTQVSARKLRYQFYEEQMQRFGADYLALGHHGDDQAETVLMGVTRGTSLSALKGIPAKRPFAGGWIVRPFLAATKKQIEAYCQKYNIMPRIDPSNMEDTYTRNYFRLHIIPLLKKKNPNFLNNIQRLSESVVEDELFLGQEAQKLFEKEVELPEHSRSANFKIESFAKFPIALQRRAFHLILNYLYCSMPPDLSYVHEEQFFNLLSNSKANAAVDLPGGLKMVKAYHFINFYFEKDREKSFYITLDGPDRVLLPGGSELIASITNDPTEDSRYDITYDLARISWPLSVRSRKNGDKMRVRGMNGTKKIKDIFIDEKVPLSQRESWPVVEDGEGNILWLAGLKKGVGNDSEKAVKFLRLHYDKKSTI